MAPRAPQPAAPAAPDDVVYEGSDLEALMSLRRYRQWIMDRIRDSISGRTLEVGAGLGAFSDLIRPHAGQLDMVEPSANLVPALRRRMAGVDGTTVFAGTYEDWLAQSAPDTYDTVIMINVLEHIEDDAAALAGTRRALRPGGRLIVFVPALMALYSRIDELVGHFRRYHMAPLTALVEGAGFTVREKSYFDLLGMAPWWLVNTLLGSTSFNPALAGLYDAVGVPVTRAVESLLPPPVGKNILLIAEK
ncbi:MAG: class I SAM-dependent methyltransferase [Hyphomicrobiales bacterium]|nr:class I SAM-dependent methyltransferase [Hyphomicrobiales bacterium]MCP5370517.1 class I SAM-dependent methyltransferase [Hyphomicrobiales bacterium]